MPVLTRRAFLEQAGVLGGVVTLVSRDGVRSQGLDRFMVPAVPCEAKPTLTPSADVSGDFKIDSPHRRALVEPGMAGKPISLTGTVIGLTCGRIKGARVDLWQADARGVIDQPGHRLRGHQFTDAEGRYAFDTILPGATGGQAPRLNLRVEVPPAKTPKAARPTILATALFFPGDERNAKDARFRQELIMKTAPASANAAAYVFDVILNL